MYMAIVFVTKKKSGIIQFSIIYSCAHPKLSPTPRETKETLFATNSTFARTKTLWDGGARGHTRQRAGSGMEVRVGTLARGRARG
jgi:hypothetical protein